jgi:hypothetical protein
VCKQAEGNGSLQGTVAQSFQVFTNSILNAVFGLRQKVNTRQ